jgi:hypothetical protein
MQAEVELCAPRLAFGCFGLSGFDRPLARVSGGLSAVLRAEFVQNRVDVVVHRSLADEQSVGDRGVAVPDGQKFQYLAFTSGQALRIGAGSRSALLGFGYAYRTEAMAVGLPDPKRTRDCFSLSPCRKSALV